MANRYEQKLKYHREKKNPQKVLEKLHKHISYTFGMTLFEYNELFVKQEGCCGICKQHQTTFERRLAVDHCHETGKIRGLLCMKCNQGIGQLKDSIEVLSNAIEYLKEFK